MYDWVGRMTERGGTSRMRWLKKLPRPLVWACCWLMGWLTWAAAAGLRRTVQRNMADVLSGLAPGRIRRLARAYFRHFFLAMYEIWLDADRLTSDDGDRFCSTGEEQLKQALAEGRGVILFAPHMGNFFYSYWFLSRRYNCLTVATGGSRELRPLYERFQALGCRGLDYDAEPPLKLLRTLREHLRNNGVVFLLGDFWRPAFPVAPLFGRLTRSPEGAATLALEQRVPVVPFYGVRDRGFRHRLVFGRPLYLYERYQRHQRAEATAELNRYLERMICGHPDQWFYWFQLHQRWEPEAASGEHAPGGAASG